MRADSVLKWLVDARNTIVKEGDLATHSNLRIAVVNSWFEFPSIEVEAPLFTKAENFAKIVTEGIPESFSPDTGLLRVERRWVDSKFPSRELLEALAHTFGILSELLFDAHKSLLSLGVATCCPWYTRYTSVEGRPPPCMLAQLWDRTIWIDVRTGERLMPTVQALRTTEKNLKKATTRYFGGQAPRRKSKLPGDLVKDAAIWFEHAKTVLQKDGYHQPIAIVGHADGSCRIHVLVMDDRSDKYLVFRQLATEIEKIGGTSVVVINEMWVSKVRDGGSFGYPSDDPDRREALALVAADASGKICNHLVFFDRDENGKIRLSEQSIVTDDNPFFLAPILAVWSKRQGSLGK